MDGWINGWIDEKISKCMNKWIDEWTEVQWIGYTVYIKDIAPDTHSQNWYGHLRRQLLTNYTIYTFHIIITLLTIATSRPGSNYSDTNQSGWKRDN